MLYAQLTGDTFWDGFFISGLYAAFILLILIPTKKEENK